MLRKWKEFVELVNEENKNERRTDEENTVKCRGLRVETQSRTVGSGIFHQTV